MYLTYQLRYMATTILNGHIDPTFFHTYAKTQQTAMPTSYFIPNMWQKQICHPTWAHMQIMLIFDGHI